MFRLYHQFYLTIVLSLLLLVMAAGAVWRYGARIAPGDQAIEMAGELIAAALPPADAPASEQERAVVNLGRRLHIDLGLYAPSGSLVANSGRPVLPPGGPPPGSGWIRAREGHAWAFRLPDDRTLVARAPSRHRSPAAAFTLLLGGLALAVALGAFPVVRRLTRRLERLQQGVERLGGGDLSARIPVEGRDEIARLTASFNGSAARIEQLVDAHKMLLANASHELRTPLSRLRLGLELMEREQADPQKWSRLRAQIEADIAEIDKLVEEILLASRIDARARKLEIEKVDLLGLAAEEAVRFPDVSVSGTAVTIDGDARLLRRMIRNLLENAHRHGQPPVAVTVASEVRGGDATALIRVEDHGAPIADADRDRIFEPFYRSSTSAGSGATTGSGIGLALVRTIAREHDGEAVLEPRAKEKNTFSVTLPILRPGRDAAGVATATSRANPARSSMVLLG